MAHKVETMAYAGEVPWHGLGTKVEDNLTPAEMMKAAGLDWTVSKRPAEVKDNDTYIKSDDWNVSFTSSPTEGTTVSFSLTVSGNANSLEQLQIGSVISSITIRQPSHLL